MYEYLTKSKSIFFLHLVKQCFDFVLFKGIHSSNQQQTLRRGMSVALAHSEKPAPPVRRTPSMNTNIQQTNNNYTKVRLKCVQEKIQDEFPPPPPDYLLSNDTKPSEPSNHASLLAEIQRGGFKLRKTVIEKDRSAPRIK